MTNGSHMENFFGGSVYGNFVFEQRPASLQNIMERDPYAIW